MQQATLYWAGRNFSCTTDAGGNCIVSSNSFGDQELTFDGSLTTGTIVGTEGQAPSQHGDLFLTPDYPSYVSPSLSTCVQLYT